MIQRQKIAIGLSGGVDSSVSALLLKEAGHDVTGIFMKNWEEEDASEYCTAAVDLADAQSICERLDIPLVTVNFAKEYWDKVFEYFLTEYQAGRTPNPDILCNREIKFKAFLDYALEQGMDGIAMGHYAQTQQTDNGEIQLCKGLDNNKDQSYFLYALGQSALRYSQFPIGHLQKSKVRAMAEAAKLVTYNKKDSTGICFIGERKFKDFLQNYLGAKPGRILTPDGTEIGQHDGLMYYTLGQRQGLGVGGMKNNVGGAWYVAGKNLEENNLIAVQDHDHPLLLKTTLGAEQTHFIAGQPPAQQFTAQAKTRYRQTPAPCEVTVEADGHWTVNFQIPQWAITPGQSVVLYQDEICLGGGVIMAPPISSFIQPAVKSLP